MKAATIMIKLTNLVTIQKYYKTILFNSRNISHKYDLCHFWQFSPNYIMLLTFIIIGTSGTLLYFLENNALLYYQSILFFKGNQLRSKSLTNISLFLFILFSLYWYCPSFLLSIHIALRCFLVWIPDPTIFTVIMSWLYTSHTSVAQPR